MQIKGILVFSVRRKWLHGAEPDCRQVQMDRMRIFVTVLVALTAFSRLLAQEKAVSTKADDALWKAQATQLQQLKDEITAQGEKIDKLTQQVETLTDALKQKTGATVPRAEPAQNATPTPAKAEPGTAGVEKPSPADSGNAKTHVVAKGETLTQISKQYGVSVEEIEQLNKIGDAKKLHVARKHELNSIQIYLRKLKLVACCS
jgi:LysM repeat protein